MARISIRQLANPCWEGLGLTSPRDLCAFRLLWRREGIYYKWGRRWVPVCAGSPCSERGTGAMNIGLQQGSAVAGCVVLLTTIEAQESCEPSRYAKAFSSLTAYAG